MFNFKNYFLAEILETPHEKFCFQDAHASSDLSDPLYQGTAAPLNRTSLVNIQTPAALKYVTLGNLLSFSGPRRPYLQRSIIRD